MWKKITIPALCLIALVLTLSSCEQEVLEPGQMVTGEYALDDGSGLSAMYLSFEAGKLSVFTLKNQKPVTLAENKYWNCLSDYFVKQGEYYYSIQSGVLVSSYQKVPITLTGDKLLFGDQTFTRIDGFEKEPYSTIEAILSLTVPYVSGEASVPVSVTNPIPAGTFTAVSNNNWISNIKVMDGTLQFSFSEVKEDRDGTIQLSYTNASDQIIHVYQRPSTFIILPLESNSVDYTGQSSSFAYSVLGPIAGSSLSVTCDASWVKNISVSASSVDFFVDENPGKTTRQAQFTLSYPGAHDKTYFLTQDWATTRIVPSPGSCTCDYKGGSFSFGVSIENPRAGVVVTATSNSNWITDIVQAENKVTFKVAENNTGGSRTGKIILTYGDFASLEFPVMQTYSESSLVLSPGSATMDYKGVGGSFTFEVRNPREGISCTATSQTSWITNVSINGNTVTYYVSENNSGATRSGSVKLSYGSFATAVFNVTQTWSGASFVLSPASATTDYKGGSGSFTFEVKNPRDGVSNSASSQVNWISDVSISGSRVSYKVAQNNSASGRKGTIILYHSTYAKTEFVLTQSGQPVTSLSLNKTSLTLDVGASETLTATIVPSDAKVVWSSGNNSVATVVNGKVSGVAPGQTTIYAKSEDGSKTATCAVTVKAINVPVTGVSLSSTSLNIYRYDIATLTATVYPSNATNKAVSWSSNKSDIVYVDSNGKITGLAEGSATITVKTADGGFSAQCYVTVKDDGHQAVDLGLSVKWATTNYGTTSTTATGGYYMWGDPKGTAAAPDYTAPNVNFISGTSYDIVRKNWGGSWRIPSRSELSELFTKCSWKQTTVNGVSVFRVTGPNGNSIIVPFTGLGYPANGPAGAKQYISTDRAYMMSGNSYSDSYGRFVYVYYYSKDGKYNWESYNADYVYITIRPVR